MKMKRIPTQSQELTLNNNVTERSDETRHYFEVIGATPGVNRNLYELTEEAMEGLAEGYAAQKPLTINHDRGAGSIFTNPTPTVGYGATTAAEVRDGILYITAYIALKKTYPNGPLGTSEELRDALIDGFVNRVSISYLPKRETRAAICSVCQKDYFKSGEDGCRHYRGQEVVVGEGKNRRVETVHIVFQKVEPLELSLVMTPADPDAAITNPAIQNALNDFYDEEKFNTLYNSEPLNSFQQEIQKYRYKGEPSTMTPEEKAALEAERDALQSQLDATTRERDALKQQLQTTTDEKTALEATAAENAQTLEDGKQARTEYVEAYVTAYVASVGPDCTEEQKERRKGFTKNMSISQLKEDTDKFQAEAERKFPSGRQTQNSATKKTDAPTEETPRSAPPIGIGYPV